MDDEDRKILSELVNRVHRLELQMIELKVEKKKPNSVEKSIGIPVWESYLEAFKKRYGIEPVRNAKVNRNCLDIAKRLGIEATDVVRFYLTLTDPQFLRMNHPLGILLFHCESIHSMWRRGSMTTSSEARIAERRINSVSASQKFLQRKHGTNDGEQG